MTKKCKRCGACQECGAVQPIPYPVYPVYPYAPWGTYPAPYRYYPNTYPAWTTSGGQIQAGTATNPLQQFAS